MSQTKVRNKIAIVTLGCKVNQYESAGIAKGLTDKGYDLVPFNAHADVYIVNTCTVTEKTDYQSRQMIRRANRVNPQALIIVTGCYAQTSPERVKALPGVIGVAGTAQKENLPEMIDQVFKVKNAPAEIFTGMPPGTGFRYSPDTSLLNHTRAFLKIQDGCNSFCSYCIVPYARGRSRSLEPDQVFSRISHLVSLGYQEIVLTGIHLGMYGLDLNPPTRLADLLYRIEELHPGPSRLRLSSLEPMEITDDLIALTARSAMICRHFHIPLQSGCNKILTAMKRCYNSRHFKEVIEKIINGIPDVAIGIDVMAGFPGEDDADFTTTADFISDLPIAYLHVFPYSKRAGTEAARLDNHVNEGIKKERALILRKLGQEKRRLFNQRFLGETLPILIENKPDRETGLWKGFSDNYISVLVTGSSDLKNRIINAKIVRVTENKAYGSIGNGE